MQEREEHSGPFQSIDYTPETVSDFSLPVERL